MKIRDALSDILRNKSEVPKTDPHEENNVYVIWKCPCEIGERSHCSISGEKTLFIKIELGPHLHHTSKNSSCDKELTVEKSQ